jgi:hypothetical protein
MLGAVDKQTEHVQQARQHWPVPETGDLAMSLQQMEA